MATSGVVDFSVNRNQICRQAGLMTGHIGAGVTMSGTMLFDFVFQLNAILKRWEAAGLHMWTTCEATLFPVAGQVKYEVGTGATDHIAESYYETTLDGSEALGQTVLSVAATTNMANDMIIGVMLDSGALHWSTIASFVAGDTVTIDDALPSAAASGNKVYFYTANIAKPKKVIDYRRRELATLQDVSVTMVARYDYNQLSDKFSAGLMQQAWYEVRRETGHIYVYKVPATVTHFLNFTWLKPIEVFLDAADELDMPAEWVQALVFNLALAMAPTAPSLSPQRYNEIKEQAIKYQADLEGFDRETEGVQLHPDFET